MKKITKLRICDRTLLIFTLAGLASAIQLEATDSQGIFPVVVHIVTCVLFCVLVLWHIYLHYGDSNWFKRFSSQKKQMLRILWWMFLLTLISGIAAATHWLINFTHSPLGGIHGKIGFVAIILSVLHIYRRYRFLLPGTRS